MNPYVLANLSGIDQRLLRVLQDMTDRMNFLSGDIERVRGSISSQSIAGAQKENPQTGIITIPSRDAGGQDGAIRVSRDGVISSYVNPIESLFPYIDISSVGNVGSGLDNLHSFILPANSLKTNGDYLTVIYGGSYAANDNNKRVEISVDAQVIDNTGLIDIDNFWWKIIAEYIRLSSTSIRANCNLLFGQVQFNSAGVWEATAGGRVLARITDVTVSNLNSNNVTLLVQAEATADDDVTQDVSIIDLHIPRTRKLV